MQVFTQNNAIQTDAADIRQSALKVNTSKQLRGFGEVFNEKLAETRPLHFSKHASLRLNARDLTLTGEQLNRVENGISQAREKGINDSLILVDSVALVVNIRNKVVVTAMNSEADNIFTNIDGAVIV